MKRFALALGAIAIAAASQASTVTDSFDLGLKNTDLQNYTGSLDKFDASLGTLTGVSIQVRGGLQGTIHLTLGASQQATSNVRGVTTSFFDFGSSIMPSGDLAPWMALEWLEGRTLQRDLDARSAATHRDRRFTLRWVLIHMIEETAQHRGHLDLLYENLSPNPH